MYFVITIMLLFHGPQQTDLKEYKLRTFDDTWACHAFIAQNKIKLLSPHVIEHGNNLRSFEFYCESRRTEEV